MKSQNTKKDEASSIVNAVKLQNALAARADLIEKVTKANRELGQLDLLIKSLKDLNSAV